MVWIEMKFACGVCVMGGVERIGVLVDSTWYWLGIVTDIIVVCVGAGVVVPVITLVCGVVIIGVLVCVGCVVVVVGEVVMVDMIVG